MIISGLINVFVYICVCVSFIDIVHAIHFSSVLAHFSSEKLGFFYDLKENALEVTRVTCRCVLSSCPSYILILFSGWD